MARFVFDPNRLNSTLAQQGKEYNLRLLQRGQTILSTLLDGLGSNYVSAVQGPNYTQALKAVAMELARIELALEDVDRDRAVPRSDFLWPLVGYMALVNGKVPNIGYSDEEFRDFFAQLIRLYFGGSVPQSVQDIVGLFFSVKVTEDFLIVRESGHEQDLSGQFTFGVDYTVPEGEGFPAYLFEAEAMVRQLLDLVRPAHTLYRLRFVFTDPVEVVSHAQDEIRRWDMSSYFYDDIRSNWHGVNGLDRLGQNQPRRQTESYDVQLIASSRSIYTARGPLVKPGTTGVIADAAEDVTVLVDGAEQTANIESVNGLLGQIVLTQAPSSGAQVAVEYWWLDRPTLEIRRLNAPEYRLNGVVADRRSGVRSYPYLSALIRPRDIQAKPLPKPRALAGEEPQKRGMKYRAYEREYSAVLNDPGTLLLNTPTNQTSFPGLSRRLSPRFVNYAATVLPERALPNAWTRVGSGEVEVAAGVLSVKDTRPNSYPVGVGIFWTSPVDMTFPNAFAMTWRAAVASATPDGAYTGVAAGFAGPTRALVVGYLLDPDGKRRVGLLRGGGGAPSALESWTSAELEWDRMRSYRISATAEVISLYVDGTITPTVTLGVSELPMLEEVDAPFAAVQGVFFGSLSAVAMNESQWSYVRYLVSPTNVEQTAPSVSVIFEASRTLPESQAAPWTPVGSHGNATVQVLTNTQPRSYNLLLRSTSANRTITGLVDGDFRGYFRIEPLLAAAYETKLDLGVVVDTFTHGVSRDAMTAAIDDGERLIQVSFLADQGALHLGYGGRGLPEEMPERWQALNHDPSLPEAKAQMEGRYLRLITTDNGRLYVFDDLAGVVQPDADFFFEFRVRVDSFEADQDGFVGVTAAVDDVAHSFGVKLAIVDGVERVLLHVLGVSVYSFDVPWNDGQFHIFRLMRFGDAVTLRVDDQAPKQSDSTAPTPAVSSFEVTLGLPKGNLTFGSSTSLWASDSPMSAAPGSDVTWDYVNYWRAPAASTSKFVGIWNGSDSTSLSGYHLPLRLASDSGQVIGNVLTDPALMQISVGDELVIDDGPNRGSYVIHALAEGVVTVDRQFPEPTALGRYRILHWNTVSNQQQTLAGYGAMKLNTVTDRLRLSRPKVDGGDGPDGVVVDQGPNKGFYSLRSLGDGTATLDRQFASAGNITYRVVRQTDWTKWSTTPGRTTPTYSIQRTVSGEVQLAKDGEVLVRCDHSPADLPSSKAGIGYEIAGGLPCVYWGAFDPANISASRWQLVRYLAMRSLQQGLVPYHQVLNQRNVVASTEYRGSLLPYVETDYWSGSDGAPTQLTPDVLRNPALVANTQLNEGTPLVPLTQTGRDKIYSRLRVVEDVVGVTDLLAPCFDELVQLRLGPGSAEAEQCLTYVSTSGAPPAGKGWIWATNVPTPAPLVSVVVTDKLKLVSALHYRVVGCRSAYVNATPLVRNESSRFETRFAVRVDVSDVHFTGDPNVRFGVTGMSGIGLGVVLQSRVGGHWNGRVAAFDVKTDQAVGGVGCIFVAGRFYTYILSWEPAYGSYRVRRVDDAGVADVDFYVSASLLSRQPSANDLLGSLPAVFLSTGLGASSDGTVAIQLTKVSVCTQANERYVMPPTRACSGAFVLGGSNKTGSGLNATDLLSPVMHLGGALIRLNGVVVRSVLETGAV